jgi:hypothetical protein
VKHDVGFSIPLVVKNSAWHPFFPRLCRTGSGLLRRTVGGRRRENGNWRTAALRESERGWIRSLWKSESGLSFEIGSADIDRRVLLRSDHREPLPVSVQRCTAIDPRCRSSL